MEIRFTLLKSLLYLKGFEKAQRCMIKKFTHNPNALKAGSLAIFFSLLFIGPLKLDATAQVKNNEKETQEFIFESFDLVDIVEGEELPVGWTAEDTHPGIGLGYFRVLGGNGIDGSQYLTRTMASFEQVSSWITPEVQLGDNPIFSCMYRVVNNTNYPDDATPADRFILQFQASTDGGVNYTTFATIDNNNHIESNQYASFLPDISAYSNQTVKFRMRAVRNTGIFRIDFDDVIVGEFSTVDFSVKNSNNEGVSDALISIPDVASTNTDSNGNATLLLPDGVYNFVVSSDNFLTYSEDNLVVSAANITVPEITLIGNYLFTFDVQDQDNNPVSTAQIEISGQAQSYDGTAAFSTTFVSNLAGVASGRLPEGSYDYSVAKADFYPVEGSIVSIPSPGNELITLQSYPLVTFFITDNDSQPLEGVQITIPETNTSLVTDINGLATKKLPIGSYSYSAYKIGYLENSADFDIINNDNLSLPALVLEAAPPTLEFVTDISEGIIFRKTLIGKTSPVRSLTFRNIGQDVITINPSDINIIGQDASLFGFTPPSEPILLPTGAAHTIDFIFSPDTEGNKSAELTMEDNTTKLLYSIPLLGFAYESVDLPFDEDFESGTFENWVVVNGDQTNQWHIGNALNDSGNFSAMISDDEGVTNNYQTGGATSIVHFYMDFNIPEADPGDLFLSFDWKGNGENNIDVMRVYFISPDVLPTAGNTISGSIGTNFFLQPTWQSFNYVIPSTHFGQTKRIVFSWINNASAGAQPPISIDNIYIGSLYTLTTATNPAAAGTITGAGSYGGNMPVALEATPEAGYTFTHWSAPAGAFADANSPTTEFTMPAEDVTVTANFTFAGPAVSDVTETYDGTEYSLAAGVPSGVDVIWYNAEVDGEVIPVPTSTDAGVFTAWAATTQNGAESTRTQATLTVLPREITITADDKEKVFGDADPDLTWSITEGTLVTGDEITGDLTREAGEDVGTYAIEQGTLAISDNYDLTFVPGEFTIVSDNILITVTAETKSKVYGDADPELTWVLTSGALEPGDEITGSLTRDAGEDVGDYAITQGTLAAPDNYDLTFVDGTLSITQRQLVINVAPQTKVYGDADPDLTYVLIDETLQFDDAFTGELTREPGEDVGTYAILQGTLTAGDNYTYVYEGDDLTITERTVTLTADNLSKVYGEDDPVLTVTLSDGLLISGDAITGTPEREAGEDVGTYDILQGTVAISNNYTITFVPGVFTITTKELTIGGSFTVADKDFDGTTDATITDNQLTLNGVKTADDITLTNVTASFDNEGPGDDILVTLATAELSGTGMANYTLSPDNWPTTTASIFALTYDLTINITPVDGGTVTGEGTFEEGTAVALMATPADEHIFVRWEDASGTELSTDASYSYTMPAADVTLTAVFQPETGVNEADLLALSLYPNPARDHVTIKSGSTIEQVVIMDISGRTVFAETINHTETRISTTGFHQGIYLVRIHTTEGVQMRKLEVK